MRGAHSFENGLNLNLWNQCAFMLRVNHLERSRSHAAVIAAREGMKEAGQKDPIFIAPFAWLG